MNTPSDCLEDSAVKERLKAARVASGLTCDRISILLNIPTEILEKYESPGQRILATDFIRMCKLYNVDICDIIHSNCTLSIPREAYNEHRKRD